VLRNYNIDPQVVSTLQRLMKQWRAVLSVNGKEISLPIKILNGIFQGDSLSPLLFITALNPISWYVGQKLPGIELEGGRRINHLLYVDDWKLLATTRHAANTLATTVQEMSEKAGLRLNTNKCAVALLNERGDYGVTRGTTTEPIECTLLSQFPVISDATELTKYLGLCQGKLHDDKEDRQKIEAEIVRRVAAVLKLEGNSQQLITAINQWALGGFKYFSPNHIEILFFAGTGSASNLEADPVPSESVFHNSIRGTSRFIPSFLLLSPLHSLHLNNSTSLPRLLHLNKTILSQLVDYKFSNY
jgi:hypothetical protein